ncbi:MAG: sortase [Parcubacteria group bacterium]|jgi:LPXTG-site transpeptidase (sortase) family protein
MSFTNFFKKYSNSLKSIALAVGVFLAVYAVLYYRTDWNTKPVFEKASNKIESSFAGSIDFNEQNLAVSNGITLADYNEWAKKYAFSASNAKLNADPDGDGLPNYLEYIHGTDPKNADTDGDGFSDKQEITNGYDPSAPGNVRTAVEVSIAKIGVIVPMVWSKSENEKDQLADLASGVAHFPQTASPGQSGNMIISGHSSNYIWAKGGYNYIFKNLNNLTLGDVVDVKTIQQNGKIIIHHYKIGEKFTTIPDDERIFNDTSGATLTLSTCWPIGSNARRLIVKGELVQ